MDKDVEDGQHCHLKDPPAHRGATTPPSTQPPRHTATQAPTVSSIIPAAHTEARRTRHAAPQKTPHHEPPRPNRRPLHPKHPMSPRFHRDGLHFEQALGGFATIDHRHAGDTPQRSAYGSNSPTEPKPAPKHPQASTGAPRSNRKPPQHTQHIRHIQHTRRGAAASAVAPLPGSQPETCVT